MKALRLASAFVALGLSIPGLADSSVEGAADIAESPKQTIDLIVYGDDTCPQGEGDEIVVCARQPESERYRIPKKLRDRSPLSGSESWTSRITDIEDTQRDSLPTHCGVVTVVSAGCFSKIMRLWRAERRMMESEGQP
jgi:hypothetical protein